MVLFRRFIKDPSEWNVTIPRNISPVVLGPSFIKSGNNRERVVFPAMRVSESGNPGPWASEYRFMELATTKGV